MMVKILITSSVLILALLILRRAFTGILSRRFQYALWSLVLIRLLVPMDLLPAADFSVLTAAKPLEQAMIERLDGQPYYSYPQGQVSQIELEQRDISPESIPTVQDRFVLEESDPNGQFATGYLVRDPDANTVTRYAAMTVGPWKALNQAWKIGMVLMGSLFLLSNLAFYVNLRKNRRPFFAGSAARKVYLLPDGIIPSPCLFGWSIYITPTVANDENKLRHVLCHEETHARHWDPVWSLLRCVCLTVYWFDPLVWIAAARSKADCELACDESVLEILGERERIPYGQTLLSLIPVKRASNPMLAATTMTAGKKQLKDRVKRIAQKPRRALAAALSAALLAGAVSACTFTGSKSPSPTVFPNPSPSQGAAENALRPLTGEELRWFNEEFFNSSGVDQTGEAEFSYNLRNQFANPLNLYEKPEDINLYELFYLEGENSFPLEELNAALGYDSWDTTVCPVYKLTAQAMDAILENHIGQKVDQTSKTGLDNFVYAEEYNAYYWQHGDTNYCGDLDFTTGTRDGSAVKLYHRSSFTGGGWYCVTLEESGETSSAGEGPGYYFISNLPCEKPAISPPLPAREPEAVISLANLEPYRAPAITVTPHVGDFVDAYENRLENWDINGHNVVVYRSTDGHIYAALRQEDGTMDVFFTLPNDNCELFFFDDILGHSGFYLHYGEVGGSGGIYEYFYFDSDATPVRLLETTSSPQAQLDMNGDGSDELIAIGGFFFQRDGQLYWVEFTDLEEYFPGQMENIFFDRYGKNVTFSGRTQQQDWVRYLYFDGENLLLY